MLHITDLLHMCLKTYCLGKEGKLVVQLFLICNFGSMGMLFIKIIVFSYLCQKTYAIAMEQPSTAYRSLYNWMKRSL